MYYCKVANWIPVFALLRAKVEKKVPLTQIVDGRLLAEAQKEFGLK